MHRALGGIHRQVILKGIRQPAIDHTAYRADVHLAADEVPHVAKKRAYTRAMSNRHKSTPPRGTGSPTNLCVNRKLCASIRCGVRGAGLNMRVWEGEMA